MKEERDSRIPFSCTLEYDRAACGDCVCATCYQQEFCDRCSTCENLSRKKEHCYRYEGAYNYWSRRPKRPFGTCSPDGLFCVSGFYGKNLHLQIFPFFWYTVVTIFLHDLNDKKPGIPMVFYPRLLVWGEWKWKEKVLFGTLYPYCFFSCWFWAVPVLFPLRLL